MTIIRSLSQPQIDRCWRFGKEMVEELEKGNNNICLDRAEGGIEHDPIKQGRSKMGEWALCKYLNVYPGTLDWDVKKINETGDRKAHDLIKYLCRIDVKHTTGRLLIWPRFKNDRLKDREVDVLWLVTGVEPDFTIRGWVRKQTFIEKHLVAGPDLPFGLWEGTWYMEEGLNPPEAFGKDWRTYEHVPPEEHWCETCGAEASYGIDYFPRHGKPGVWYCKHHRP